jgi:hypothetical protein
MKWSVPMGIVDKKPPSGGARGLSRIKNPGIHKIGVMNLKGAYGMGKDGSFRDFNSLSALVFAVLFVRA